MKRCSGSGRGNPGAGGEAPFLQRGTKKDCGSNAPTSPLYERPEYDHAAAALLFEFCGMGKCVIHGLVNHHRPNAQQIQNIIDNIEARNAESQKTPGVRPVASRAAFATAAIQNCNYTLDDRVLEHRQKDQDRSLRDEAEAEKVQETQAQKVQEQERRDEADAVWASMTDDERVRLRNLAESRLPLWQKKIHRKHSDTAPMIRALILCEKSRGTQEKPNV